MEPAPRQQHQIFVVHLIKVGLQGSMSLTDEVESIIMNASLNLNFQLHGACYQKERYSSV